MPKLEALESLERSSQEFQNLTEDQKLSRRIMLKSFLHGITSNNPNVTTDSKHAAIMTGIMLELYLTGKVDIDELPNKTPVVRKSVKMKK